MRTLLFLTMSLVCVAADSSFNGRWDITVLNEPRARVWWLEVTGAGSTQMAGRFVGAQGGGMDPISQISLKNGDLEFELKKGTYRAKLIGAKLQGTFAPDGQSDRKLTWTGERAPEIRETDDGSWKPGKPIDVFNGKDLSGWHSRLTGHDIGWKVTDGMMNNGNAGVPDLVSDAKFWNFALHVEYRIGKGSNSGVGLRGRYEVQILDDNGRPLDVHSNGALYSRIVPSKEASRPPGEWQSFDIRLVGRDVTVVLNDQKIIDKQVVEGLTAIANDPNEGKPGPIILQGDHGPVEFRKIELTPLLK
jgi:Domain of Unknown Function (DUF1080)